MKRVLFALLFLAAASAASAQDSTYQRRSFDKPEEKQKGFDRSRLFVGGGLGLGLGNRTFSANVSPLVGYRFSRLFAAGANINFQYGSDRWEYAEGNIKNSYTLVGGGVFGRVYPLDIIFVQVQPEYNHIMAKTTDETVRPKQVYKDSYTVPSLLMGVGYAQPIGGNSAFTIMVQYDVLQDERSLYYQRPVFSAGVNIGF
ncbi:hypothetical protein MKQ68_00415 [Chitinophaga horti]|uniref:Outer membrane protein beta-barrel domain-containing protein n=1 Tax=Chitinophaga horti TaxID=2920382 RepID=A0ABY6J1L7_9BACT|nr:hypothetical protein [Chitinophaga horti]UYQ93563.1 hypothetical protein MKQ68_00415 [Chitinophaga horti]